MPAAPRERSPLARTSAVDANPYRSTRARVWLAIAATRVSSALSTAQPSGGSASTSSRLPASMASIEPARERCTPRTAVTSPMAGRASLASRAISPVV